MKTFREYITEKIDLDEYTASYEKSKLTKGYRAKVINPKGKDSYVSAEAWDTKEAAIACASFYITLMNKPLSAIDREMHQFIKSYSKNIVDEN